jgi:hypothetical protein
VFRNKPTVAQLIEALPCIRTIDTMLLEGAAGADVAKFIHDDQSMLLDIAPKLLTNTLLKRRAKLKADAVKQFEEQTKDWLTNIKPEPDDEEDGEEADDEKSEDDGEEDGAVENLDGVLDMLGLPMLPDQAKKILPSAFSREIYKRTQGGIDEIIELEALYMTQRARIDRLVQVEGVKGGYIENIYKEMNSASDLLMKRVAVREKLGQIDGDSKFREQLDVAGYSKETTAVLAVAESRHRVISIMERIRRKAEKERLAKEEKKSAG